MTIRQRWKRELWLKMFILWLISMLKNLEESWEEVAVEDQAADPVIVQVNHIHHQLEKRTQARTHISVQRQVEHTILYMFTSDLSAIIAQSDTTPLFISWFITMVMVITFTMENMAIMKILQMIFKTTLVQSSVLSLHFAASAQFCTASSVSTAEMMMTSKIQSKKELKLRPLQLLQFNKTIQDIGITWAAASILHLMMKVKSIMEVEDNM